VIRDASRLTQLANGADVLDRSGVSRDPRYGHESAGRMLTQQGADPVRIDAAFRKIRSVHHLHSIAFSER
jgi:hypothetical protein